MKLPFICSQVLPYTKDLALKNKGIVFCRNTGDWYKAFKFFINNAGVVEELGLANNNYGKNKFNLKMENRVRLQVMISCLNRSH